MLVIISIIGAFIHFFAFNGSAAELNIKRSVYLEDILTAKFYPGTNNATWLTNSELLYRRENVSK